MGVVDVGGGTLVEGWEGFDEVRIGGGLGGVWEVDCEVEMDFEGVFFLLLLDFQRMKGGSFSGGVGW